MAPFDYLVLTATLPAEQSDLFVEVCWGLGTLGLQQTEADEGVTFKAYFDADFPPSRLMTELSAVEGLRPTTLAVDWEEDRGAEWLSNWKAAFTGFEAGPEIWVHPGWESASSRHPVNILMEPGHAFGTGTHESTRLCLRALPESAPARGRILDLGTGSGILAIAAAKLRPKAMVFAVDNDPLAVEMAAENFDRNSVSVALAAAGPAALRGPFDFLAANLTLSIFRRHAREIVDVARGPILASGFTDDQAPATAELFRQAGGFAPVRSWTLHGWTCLLLAR